MRACTAGSFRMRLWPRPAVASFSPPAAMLHEALGRFSRTGWRCRRHRGHQRRTVTRGPGCRQRRTVASTGPPAPRCDVAWPRVPLEMPNTCEHAGVVTRRIRCGDQHQRGASRLRDSANAAALPPRGVRDDRMQLDACLGQTCATYSKRAGKLRQIAGAAIAGAVLAHPSRWARSLRWPATPPAPSSAWRDRPSRASAAHAAAGRGHLPPSQIGTAPVTINADIDAFERHALDLPLRSPGAAARETAQRGGIVRTVAGHAFGQP